MKKGLLIIPYLRGYGGTETVINSLLSKMDCYHKLDMTTISIGGYDDDSWINHNNVHSLKYPKNRYIRTIMYMFTLPLIIPILIMKYKPDFLISTNPVMWSISYIFSKTFHIKTKIIAWYHFSYKIKPVNAFLLSKADHYFNISITDSNYLIENGIDKNKISVVYNPVIPTSKKINHSEKNNVFIYVGRLEYGKDKNISELFKSLYKINECKWKLLIYGVGPDEQKLKKLSDSLGISHHIEWKGFKSDVFNEISEADALVLTSKSEGFSMVIAEAISHGLFVVSSDCPSGPIEIINDSNGIMYRSGDTTQLSNILKEVLDRKHNLDSDTIKSSISKFYVNIYFSKFVDSIFKVIK